MTVGGKAASISEGVTPGERILLVTLFYIVSHLLYHVVSLSTSANFHPGLRGIRVPKRQGKEEEWSRFATSRKKGYSREFTRREKVPLQNWDDMQAMGFKVRFQAVPASLCSNVGRLKSSSSTILRITCACWGRLCIERSLPTLLVSSLFERPVVTTCPTKPLINKRCFLLVLLFLDVVHRNPCFRLEKPVLSTNPKSFFVLGLVLRIFTPNSGLWVKLKNIYGVTESGFTARGH
jgi:hypothetical protein